MVDAPGDPSGRVLQRMTILITQKRLVAPWEPPAPTFARFSSPKGALGDENLAKMWPGSSRAPRRLRVIRTGMCLSPNLKDIRSIISPERTRRSGQVKAPWIG